MLAGAPSLDRNYQVVDDAVDWGKPKEIDGFRFELAEDKRGNRCQSRFRFKILNADGAEVDPHNIDLALDEAVAKLGRFVEEQCPNVRLIAFYSERRGVNSARKEFGWHINRDVMKKLADAKKAYYGKPLFPLGGANPLADRGFFASRMVASDSDMDLYEAFETQKFYQQNGNGVIYVLVHNIGKDDVILTYVNEGVQGLNHYDERFTGKLNALLVAYRNKYAFSPNAFEHRIYHYVEGVHLSQKNSWGVEEPIILSRFGEVSYTPDGIPQLGNLKYEPLIPDCNCTGSAAQKYSDAAARIYEQKQTSIRVSDYFTGL